MHDDPALDLLFGDAVVCSELRPAAFLPQAPDPLHRRRACLHAETLLRSIAIIEDSRSDEPDEHKASDLALHRLEAKIDVLTTIVATLSGRERPHDPLRPLQWSVHGAILDYVTDPLPACDEGTDGLLRVEPSDSLPEALELPASVVRGAGPHLWLRLGPLTPSLELALERHLFRVHRRAVAEARRQR